MKQAKLIPSNIYPLATPNTITPPLKSVKPLPKAWTQTDPGQQTPLGQRLWSQVHTCIPAMATNRAHTLRKICGEAFWDTLSKREKIQAGQIFFDWVNQQYLALDTADKSGQNARLYIKR